MASTTPSIKVGGFPSGLSNFKLRFFVEKKVGKELLSDAERRPDGSVVFTFNSEEGLWRYKAANLTEISFGNETHPLRIVEGHTEPQRKSPDTPCQKDSLSELRDDDSWRRKLFIKNIPPHLHHYEAFKYHFERFGRVEKCFTKDNKTSMFAYVTFTNHLDAVAARHGGVSAGPQHKLSIEWDYKEEPSTDSPLPHARQGNAYNRPGSRGRHPRHLSSTNEPGSQQETPLRRQEYIPRGFPVGRGTARENTSNNRGRRGRGFQQETPLGRQEYRFRETSDQHPFYNDRYYSNVNDNSMERASMRENTYNYPPSRGYNYPPSRGRRGGRHGFQQETPLRKQEYKSQKTDEQLLFRNIHYWSNLEDIPVERGTVCVLAQDIDTSTHIDKVKMHFESQKRSNGGPVKHIIHMIDGLLIVFKDYQHCESCLQMKDQKFEEKTIKVYRKQIPTYFDRKFVLQGIGPQTTSDTLTMFLEHCSKIETSPTCLNQMIPGVFLVEYGDDMDLEEVEDILGNISSRSLEGKTLKASKLLRTDCLKISGVDGNVSSDTIKLTFESKRRTDGGPVTRVDRLKNKVVLVYFAMFADAERVYERFKNPCNESIKMGESKVEINLYYHMFASDHKNVTKETTSHLGAAGGDLQGVMGQEKDPSSPTQQLKIFPHQAGCKRNILQFLNDSQKHSDKLKEAFVGFASVMIDLKKNAPSFVKFSPDEKTIAESQKKFNTDCKKRFETFVADYTTASKNFDSEKLKYVRATRASTLFDEEYKGDLMGDVIVSWKNSTAEITGLKVHVSKHAQELESLILDLKSQQYDMKHDQIKIMVCCGIVEDLEKAHQNLTINCDDQSETITYIGKEGEIQAAHISALTMLQGVERKKLIGLEEIVIQYLADVVKGSTELKAMISKKFQADDIKATITFVGEEVWACVRSDALSIRASEAIKELFGTQRYETDGKASEIVSTPQWKRFHQSLNKKGLPRVYVKPREAIIIVGLQEDLLPIHTKISNFLDENATRHAFQHLPYGSAKFIVEKSKQFLESCKRDGVQCSLTAENGGGVSLEGKRQALEKANAKLGEIVRGIREVPRTLTEHGIKQYYQGEEGKKFLKMTEHTHNCIILAASKTCPEWEKEAIKKQRRPLTSTRITHTASQEKLYGSVDLPNSQVSIQVWKTNIVKHKCDVITNASNTDLKLLAGGISGEIRKLDGPAGVIQKEMDGLIRKNYGDFLAGDAVMTAAGSLPACKNIIHAIGPRWNSSAERDPGNKLKSCIFKSLQETARTGMKSISIPAISCGVFGGQPQVCLPLIMEAVVDYFKEETTSSITRVDFVENQKESILSEFMNCISKYGSTVNAPANSTPAPSPQLQPPTPANTSRASQASQNSPGVSLRKGDLTSTQADVLVNITSPKGFPNMQGSSVSKALLQQGGAIIQQECLQTPGPHNLGSIFRTSGGSLNCKEIFHGIITNYSRSSETLSRGIVTQCLQMADNAGYSSIAFPAIATGGFQHPPAKVALWMHEEISKFSAVNLSNVLIILHPSSPAIIPVFQAEFSGTPHLSTSISSAGSSGNSYSSATNFGGINVNVYQGDITKEKSDAIVNSTNAQFDLSQGMVSKAIVAQGGQSIQTEILNANGRDYRSTSNGTLPCGGIFHIVTPADPEDILKKVFAVLQDADQQGMRTISFPALATGGIGLSSSAVAQMMRKAFEKFGKSNFSSLKTINVVVFDKSMLNDFQKGILSSSQTIMGKMKETISSLFGGISSPSRNAPEESFHLFFYSTDTEAIDQAFECITRDTKSKVLSKVIRDEALGRLSEWEAHEIREAASMQKVMVRNISTRYIQQYQVEGLVSDVIKARDTIKDILKEFCAAETTSSFVIWEKSVNGNWEEYQPRSMHVLEKAYKVRNGNKTDQKLNKIKVPVYYNSAVHESDVDLSNVEGDAHGNNPPKVRRRVKEKATDDVLPKTWSPMPSNKPFLKVLLNPGSPEYQIASNAFSNTGGIGTIVKIERIQNESLYKQYIAKKSEVKAKMTSGMPLERPLFHGTSDDDKIVLHGFDRSYAGKHATAHGRGVYFATSASYSHSYTTPDGNGYRRMFVADVITGDYCQGSSSYVAPPPKQSGIKNDLYDSVVNNPNNPSIFVIFKDASAYPTYLVTYI